MTGAIAEGEREGWKEDEDANVICGGERARSSRSMLIRVVPQGGRLVVTGENRGQT